MFSSIWLFFGRHFLIIYRFETVWYWDVETAWYEFFKYFISCFIFLLHLLHFFASFASFASSNHSLLVFFIIAVFLKDTISLTTSINFWKKIVVCLVYIMISLIIWEYNFAQSLFVLIYLIVFKRSNWNLVAVTYFFFFYFSLAKIFIDSLRPKVLQNSRYFFCFRWHFIMFFLSSPNVEPFWCKFIFRSPSICHSSLNILSEFKLSNSISGNLVWSGGL